MMLLVFRSSPAAAACILLFALGITVGVTAQNPPQGPPSFRTGITLVEVDVSVLDKDRQPVRGLTANDFTVVEDNTPQQIRTFSAIDVADPERPATGWLRDVAPDVKSNDLARDRRLTAIVLDDAQIRPLMNQRVKDIGRRIIDRLGPDDLTAVLFTRDNRGAQEFTSDRARLLAAVDKFVAGFAPSTDNGTSTALSGPGTPAFGRTPFGPAGGDTSPMYWYRSSVNILRRLSEALADVPQRRKAILYVSVGVPLVAGGQGDMSALFAETQNMFREAQKANVNIYCIDPTGLGGLDQENPDDAGIGDSNARIGNLNREFLMTVAENTGGLALVDRNDFNASVAQVFRENGSYYLLGYESSNPKADGSFRRLSVRVKRPGLTVRVRNGYYAPKPEKPTAASPISTELQKAVAGLLPKADLRIDAYAAPFAVPGKSETAVALVLGVTQRRGAAARMTDSLDVKVSAFDPEGSFKTAVRETYRVAVRTTGEGQTTHYELLSRIDLKPGRYQLRIAARSTTEEKSGGLYYDVDVPDFSKAPLSLSALAMALLPVLGAPKDRYATILPVVPTAMRDFEPADQATVFTRIYQGGKKPPVRVEITARIVDSSGATAFQGSEILTADRFDKNRSADYQLPVPLRTLKPGPHLLTVEAKSFTGDSARRDLRFMMGAR